MTCSYKDQHYCADLKFQVNTVASPFVQSSHVYCLNTLYHISELRGNAMQRPIVMQSLRHACIAFQHWMSHKQCTREVYMICSLLNAHICCRMFVSLGELDLFAVAILIHKDYPWGLSNAFTKDYEMDNAEAVMRIDIGFDVASLEPDECARFQCHRPMGPINWLNYSVISENNCDVLHQSARLHVIVVKEFQVQNTLVCYYINHEIVSLVAEWAPGKRSMFLTVDGWAC